MENKFFLHRIRKEGDTYNKGIEVHDSLDAAIQSFHSQMKLAYNNPANPNVTYVSCMVTDGEDKVVDNYSETWAREPVPEFFLHYIRRDGETYTKGIDVFQTYAAACRSFHSQMEYGYGNSKFPNVSFVAAKITGTSGMEHKSEQWAQGE